MGDHHGPQDPVDGARRRTLLSPAAPDDTGASDPAVDAALSAFEAAPDDPERYLDALAALAVSRVLVPVVAVLGEIEYDEAGLARDKSSDMAAVLLTGADGRRALLAFTGTASMVRWNPEARPVPVPVAHAALAAVQEDAAALLVDVAGPVRFVVEGEDLQALARGWRIARLGAERGWIAPA
ncbi:hypothetical protein GCM10022215_34470 [Nocardioides fonticola]|uniref:SseB protein N-terminal domain-containing protein n=1 Tax=Nocardioides fonticola TaxID=450363 RepID=A0ABP7XUM5_9ACTN